MATITNKEIERQMQARSLKWNELQQKKKAETDPNKRNEISKQQAMLHAQNVADSKEIRARYDQSSGEWRTGSARNATAINTPKAAVNGVNAAVSQGISQTTRNLGAAAGTNALASIAASNQAAQAKKVTLPTKFDAPSNAGSYAAASGAGRQAQATPVVGSSYAAASGLKTLPTGTGIGGTSGLVNAVKSAPGMIAHNTGAGVARAVGDAYKGIDWLLPDFATPKFVQDYIDSAKENADNITGKVQEVNREKGGAVGEIAGSLYQSGIAMLPTALTTAASGGATLFGYGSQLGRAGGSAAVRALQGMVSKPAFAGSFVTQAGTAYDEAKKAGAGELAATVNALGTGFLNAGIEMSGGLEGESRQNGLRGVLQTAHEEGLEEVKQGIVSGLGAKATYDKARPWVGDGGVIDPKQAAMDYAGGAIVGGVVSAPGALRGARMGNVRNDVQTDVQSQAEPVRRNAAQQNAVQEPVSLPTRFDEATPQNVSLPTQFDAQGRAADPGTLRQGTWQEGEIKPRLGSDETERRPESRVHTPQEDWTLAQQLEAFENRENDSNVQQQTRTQGDMLAQFTAPLQQVLVKLENDLRTAEQMLPGQIRDERIRAIREGAEQVRAQLQTVENNREGLEQAKTVAERLGASFALGDLGAASGNYVNGIITINPYTENPVRQVLVHELTHYLETSGQYDALSARVLDFVAQDMRTDIGALIRAVTQDYAENGVQLDEDGARREIVAKFCEEKLFTDEKSVERLARTDRNLFQRIYDWVRDAVAKLRGSSEENKLREIERLYEKAARSVGEVAGYGREQFSFKEPVEETKDLLALHNLTEQNLIDSLQLGGLPMPSIAVVKSAQGHSKYGPISLVFGKDTIDPQADERNKVYGSDAWTPTHSDARVDYEVDYDVKREFEQNIETLANDVAGGIFAQSSVLDMAGVGGQTEMSLEEIAHKLATRYDSVRAAYLANKGRDIDIVYRTKEFDSFGNDALKSYLEKVGEQEAARLAAKMLTGERLSAAEVETVKDAIMESWTAKNEWRLNKKPELRETRIAKQREKLSDLRAEDFARNAWDFYEDGGTTTDEVNRMETAENLRHAVDDKAVEAWVLDMLHGLTGEPGIYNGSELFDARGNRKSFKETHWSYTLENIVRAMNNAKTRGQGMWGMSGSGLVATATPAYNSVQEMHADESRLRTVDSTEYEQMVKDLDGELGRVAADIMHTTEHHASNTFEEEEIIGDVIAMAAQGKRTTAGVKQTFRKEGYTISDKQARAVLNVIEHASSLPTDYFEAKPQRAVGFGEVLTAVIPSGSSDNLRDGLERAGVAVLEYKDGDEADRLAKLNSVENAKFSMGEGFSELVDRANGRRERMEQARALTDAWTARRQAQAHADTVRENLTLTRRDIQMAQQGARTGVNSVNWEEANNPEQAYIYSRALADVRAADRPIREFMARRQAGLQGQAQEDAELIARFAKDKKSGLLYQRETMERNFRDIFGKEHRDIAERMIERYIKPVHNAVAEGTRLKKELRGRVEALKLNKHERALVQMRMEGENAAAAEYIANNRINMTQELNDKINRAADEMRAIYNDLYEQVNAALVTNGYEPAPFRKNYAPHFVKDRPDTAISRIRFALGLGKDSSLNLPTDLAGITDEFRPGKKWFGNLLQREGEITDYDVVAGFDRYIETAADVITLTDQIQNLRALEDAVRYELSDEGVRDRIDEIRANDEYDALRRRQEIENVYGKNPGTAEQIINELRGQQQMGMGGFVTELRRYTDDLAGKKSKGDRGWEEMIGRQVYSVAKNVEGRVAANMIAANPGSWLTNFIPITQALGEVDTLSMLHGMADTVKAYAVDDGFADASAFLTNRRGSDSLDKTMGRRFGDALGAPMEWIDRFTADTIVRARTYQNMNRNGMTLCEAIDEADDFTAGLMADRSKGSMPTIFNQKNPAVKVFTMFQLEVNNQLSYIAKDMLPRLGEEGGAAVAMGLTKLLVGAFLFNRVYRELTGRDAALDPIGMIVDAFGIGDDEEEKPTAAEAVQSMAKDTAENLPFIGGLLGGGRVPIQSAIPNVLNVWTAMTDTEKAPEKRWDMAKKELAKPATYLLPPFGGGAAKKAYEGFQTVRQGGAYSLNNDGERELMFPQYGQSPADYALSMTFGRYRTDEAQDYVDSGFKRLSADDTAVYDDAAQVGLSRQQAYEAIKAINAVKAPEDKSKTRKQAQREAIMQMDLTPGQKAWLDFRMTSGGDHTIDYRDTVGFEITNTVRDIKQADADTAYQKFGVQPATFKRYDDTFREIYQADGKQAAMRQTAQQIKADKSIGAREQQGLLETVVMNQLSDSDREKWRDTFKGTLDEVAFLGLLEQKKAFSDKYEDYEPEDGQPTRAQLAATDFANWLDAQGYDETTRVLIDDAFGGSPIPYRYDMLEGKTESKFADAMEQTGLAIETYLDVKAYKNGLSGEDIKGRTQAYMRQIGMTQEQINAATQAFGWKVTSASGSNSGGKKKVSLPTFKATKSGAFKLPGLPTRF